MERPETFEALKKARGLGLKRIIMIAILALTVIMSIVLDYIGAGFDPTIYRSTAYWLKLLSANAAVVMALFAMRGYAKETEMVKNVDLIALTERVGEAHKMLAERDCLADFERYVNVENRRRKLAAYTGRLRRKITRRRSEKKRSELYDRVEHAEERIEYLKVRYPKVRISTLFATSDLRPSDDTDFEIREGVEISRILINKIFSIIAIGILGASIVPEIVHEVNYTMIVGTVVKLFQLAYAVFVGLTLGQSFARGTYAAKLRLRLDFVRGYIERRKAEGVKFEPCEDRTRPVQTDTSGIESASSALERLKKGG